MTILKGGPKEPHTSMMQLILGQSDDIDPSAAMHKAMEQCLQGLNGKTPNVIFFFTSIMDMDHQAALDTLKDGFSGAPLIGCTTAGEFSSLMGSTEDSVLLALICSDTLSFWTGKGYPLSSDPNAALRQALSRKKKKKADIALYLSFLDGIQGLKVSINDTLNQFPFQGIPVFGGISGDKLCFTITLHFKVQEVLTDAVASIAAQGPLLYGSSSAHGWQPIGRMGVVTHAIGNVVYEINFKPAFSFLSYYLQEDSREFLQFPLAVYRTPQPEYYPDYYLRYPCTWNAKEGWVAFSGQMLKETLVRITIPGRRQLISAAHTAIEQAIANYPGKNPVMAFCVSGAVRPQVLGSLRNHEFSPFMSGRKTPLPYFGFYSFGEISTASRQTASFCHCSSFTALVLGED